MKFNKPFKDNEPTSPLRNRTSIDVVDNFKKIQNYILTNNNAVPKPVYNNGGAFSRDNIINYEPGTSKLKKILMNSKDENQPAKEVKGKQKLFLCSDCKEYFSRLHLFQHIKSVHNKFTCLYCYGFFVSVDSLEKHLSKKHKIQNSAFLTGDQLTKYLEDTEQSIEKKLIQAVCCKCGDMLNENFLDHSCGLATLKQPEAVRELTPALINNLPDAEMDLNPPLSLQSIANNIQMPSSQAPANSILSSILSYPSSLSISSLHQTIIPTLPPIPTISPVKPVKEVVNEKLLVPKLKLSIPKVFQQNIESEEESEESESEDEQSPSKHQKTYSSSGDETDDEEEEEDEIFQQQAKILEEMNKVQNQIDSTMCKKLPKLQIKLSTKSIQPALKQEEPIVSPPPTPVHTPSIKIKIKNITSQILEPVIEQICEAGEPMNLVELTDKSLMDLDDSVGDVKTEDSLLQIKDEKPVIGNAIMIDNVSVVPAGDDILPIDIGQLDEGLDKIPIRTFMKICLKNAIPTCLYCNHARKIVVNGKSLAIHFITNHRFQATVNSITEEELKPEKILTKFESNLDNLENCYFNLDTFDNQDEDKKEGNITISHDKLFECFQCRFQTHIHKELYLHNRKMHQKALIICLMCKVHFYSYSELVCHICPGVANKKLFKDYQFYCCMCNMDNIPSAFRLMVHLRKKHFACDVCLEKCNDQCKLSNHVWKHKLHHLCYRCGIAYRNKADIQKHLFWKHGTEGVTCKRCLLKKWPHVYHFCVPPSSFTCETCQLTFNLANALKVHQRLHNNYEKYPCTEDNCDKKFISKKLLLRHVDRHFAHLTAMEGSSEEKKSNGTIIVPAVIPEGHCTRTIPIVFRDINKRRQDALDLGQPISLEVKPDVLKDNAKSERKKKKEELKAKKAAESKAADFSDLPEMKLNLSESDSSDDEEMRPKAETEHNTVQAHTEPSEMRGESNKVSKMSESEEEAECSKSKEQHSQSIWDNFKLAQQLEPKPEVKPEAPAKVFLHVVQSDHDYSRMYRKPGDVEEIKEVVPVFAPKKSSPKKKHKLAKPPGYSSSSSDSSSDSDSSSCCSKSNCSCSSSSSGSSSSSSDEGKKNKKGKKEFSSKSNDAIDVVATDATDAIPKGPDDIIYESDLVTDETETDEDFYDEHPQKLPNNNLLLAEKRRLLLLQSCGDYDGIVENSRPSTPSLPPDEISEKVEKKKLKIKKKKRERKSSKSGGSLASPIKRIHSPALHQSYNAYQDSQQYYNNSNAIYEQGGFHHSYPSAPKVPKMELHQEAEIRHLLQSNHQQPVLPIMQMQLDRERYTPSNSATSSRKNSECGDIKRSQRRRVPNRFYGYTSDDDSFSAQAQTTNNPFKPVPPPNLTWRKEDLPSGSKMRMVTPSSVKRSEFNYDDVSEYAYEPTEPPKSAPARVPISQQHLIFNDSDSSENALQINHEPRKRQRRDVTPKPPIPKLKLSIGLDNKIKKRRIQSTSTVSAQKRRKVEPIHNKRQNSEVLSFTTTSLPDSLLYDSNSSGIGAGIGLTSLLPPSQLLKSPHFDSTPSYHESYYQQQQKLTQRQLEHQGQQSKKQSLEDAIQKTQQYYRQFNHQQIRPQNQQEVKEGERLYCYCRAAYDEASEMIGCDGDNCQIEWFHFECVGILVAPKGKWYCPECQKQHMH